MLGNSPPSHLYGVAVDGLTTAAHIHHLGDLQDIVWHIAAGATAVAHLPPLLPVIQDLSEHSISLMSLTRCGPKQVGTYLHHLVLQHRKLCVVSRYKVVLGRSEELRLAPASDEAPGKSKKVMIRSISLKVRATQTTRRRGGVSPQQRANSLNEINGGGVKKKTSEVK